MKVIFLSRNGNFSFVHEKILKKNRNIGGIYLVADVPTNTRNARWEHSSPKDGNSYSKLIDNVNIIETNANGKLRAPYKTKQRTNTITSL